MENKVIFITGASGFIGNALTKRLLLDPVNVKIILLSRSSTFEEFSNYSQIVSVVGDINNTELLTYIIQSHQVTHIYHLASEAIVSAYTKNPKKSYLDTVQGVTSLLEAVRVSNVQIKKVLIGTSYKVYGRSEPPYNEETCFMPGNTYETAKACQDFIAQDYYRSFKIPVVIFRSVNVYGPGDKNISRLIPRSFRDVYNDISPTVYESFRNSVREFLYIDDLIDALFLIEEKAKPGDVFCIGGESSTIYNVVEKICEASEFSGGITITGNSDVVETQEHSLDSSKIQALGWRAKTALTEGLTKTFQYYQSLYKS